LTQEELAERSGLSVFAIRLLEQGRRRAPRATTVEFLAGALRLDSAEREALIASSRKRLTAHAVPLSSAPEARLPNQQAEPPFPPVADFVGRGDDLEKLRQLLIERKRAAVHGLGGVGKTQLAAQYQRQHQSHYPDGVFWVHADGETSLLTRVGNLAIHLGLSVRSDGRLEEQVQAVVRWFQQRSAWLLVLDNVEPEAVPTLDRLLPADLQGHVLATSRTPMWPARLALRPLPVEAAASMLLRGTGQADVVAARDVAEQLGCLPLALRQAAAYLDASGRDLASYAGLLQTRLADLMAEGAPDDHPHPVATTWRLCFDPMEGECPAAAALLRLCAFLGPDDIPIGMLEAGASELPAELRSTLENVILLDRAIGALRRYSLMERHGDVLRVHRLLQAVVRDSLAAEPRRTWLGAAIRLLDACFPAEADDHPESWPLVARLLPHAQALEPLAAQEETEPVSLARLLHRTGAYLDGRGELALALPYVERALQLRERTLEPDSPEIAESLDDMACLLLHGGDRAGAAGFYGQALAIRERVMGPDHPATATSLNNMAVLLHGQGDLARARHLYERALSIDERMLGPCHLHTTKDLNNLGRLLCQQGELVVAESLLTRALSICERDLGPDHPLTATSLNNLGRLLREQGRPAVARPLLERCLETYERVLGGDHPYTAVALANLSGLFRELGDPVAAARYAERAIAVQRRSLGPDHPDLAIGLISLALALHSRGRLATPIRLLRRALALKERIGGADDPLTASGRRLLKELGS
jgi:tetratricopeptide (TPR) repeat protein/transcriptional regulator with XRE-family HTH domain